MLTELRPGSQVTIPKDIIVKLGLAEGDALDIYEKDGSIFLIPVAMYPERYLEDLQRETDDVKTKLTSGEQPVFENVDALFDALDAD